MKRANKKLFNSVINYFVTLLLLSAAVSYLSYYMSSSPYYYDLNAYTCETDEFRRMDFGENGLESIFTYAQNNNFDPYMVMAVVMLNNSFENDDITKQELLLCDYNASLKHISRFKEKELKILANAYRILLDDLVYFPIPGGNSERSRSFYYDDSWGGERTYGGERTHEGTDIMDGENERGFFPIISISSGAVENIGWLEQGGWRVGIRTGSGAYIYYAHLHSYAPKIFKGYEVRAGELLGFMGDTGYSKTEGATGNFDVHLHLGIYFQTAHYEELSVNPYYILKYLENKKLKYSY